MHIFFIIVHKALLMSKREGYSAIQSPSLCKRGPGQKKDNDCGLSQPFSPVLTP